jgi:hypothetical protein
MKHFSTTTGDEELSTLLNIVCKSKELCDIQLRRTEKVVLNELNKHKHKAVIREAAIHQI